MGAASNDGGEARPAEGRGLLGSSLSHLKTLLTKSSTCECHHEALPSVSLFLASSFQHCRPFCAAYLLRSSSQRNHLVRLGRFILKCAIVSTSSRQHSLSRHSVTRRARRAGSIRTTCPAHLSLSPMCRCSQNLRPAPLATLQALRVERFIQSTHSSSGDRAIPTILRTMV